MARTKQAARRRRDPTETNVVVMMKVPASHVDNTEAVKITSGTTGTTGTAEFIADTVIIRRIVRKMMRAGQTARLVTLAHDITTAAVHAAVRSQTR